MRIEPLTPRFGALVTEVDFADLSEQEWAQIHTAWLERGGLLVLRGQEKHTLDPKALKSFAGRFRVPPLRSQRTRLYL